MFRCYVDWIIYFWIGPEGAESDDVIEIISDPEPIIIIDSEEDESVAVNITERNEDYLLSPTFPSDSECSSSSEESTIHSVPQKVPVLRDETLQLDHVSNL